MLTRLNMSPFCPCNLPPGTYGASRAGNPLYYTPYDIAMSTLPGILEILCWNMNVQLCLSIILSLQRFKLKLL